MLLQCTLYTVGAIDSLDFGSPMTIPKGQWYGLESQRFNQIIAKIHNTFQYSFFSEKEEHVIAFLIIC